MFLSHLCTRAVKPIAYANYDSIIQMLTVDLDLVSGQKCKTFDFLHMKSNQEYFPLLNRRVEPCSAAS